MGNGPNQERRRFPRVDIACPISVVTQGGEPPIEGKTVNLSRGGAFIRIPLESAPKDRRVVDVHLMGIGPDREGPGFRCKATVIRHEKTNTPGAVGLALQFDRILPFDPAW